MGGSYRIWIDQGLYAEGHWSSSDPITIALPMQRLSEPRPLKIGIWVRDDGGQVIADYFNPLFGSGFETREQAWALARFTNFWSSTRPLALFVANLMVAILFFSLWIFATEKAEYFYMAIFALIGAIYQIRMMDFFIDWSSPDHRYLLQIVLRFYEATFGMFLGLSFARIRGNLFKWGIPITVAIPFLVIPFLQGAAAKSAFSHHLDTGLASLLVAIGAASCLGQAVHLKTLKTRGFFHPTRIRHLFLFGGGLLFLALFQLMDGLVAFSAIGEALRFRVGHLAVVLLLSVLALQEYRAQKYLIEKTPVSPYHRRPILPESLHGAILSIDLRNSEFLSRLGAEHFEAGLLVGECLSHMWTAVTSQGGVILRTEGDGLLAFFDSANRAFPVLHASRAVQEISSTLPFLREKIQSAQDLGGQDIHLGFRAGLALGSIRPVWQNMGDTRHASWTEAGNTMPLVESARLMEIERKLGSSAEDCLVVMPEATARSADSSSKWANQYQWKLRDYSVLGKHEVQYRISVLDLAVRNEAPREASDVVAA